MDWAVVYGVNVDGEEGRSGMAAIKLSDDVSFDGPAFFEHLASNLTPSSLPRWIKLTDDVDMTASFKIRSSDLAEQGVSGPNLYALDAKEGSYVLAD